MSYRQLTKEETDRLQSQNCTSGNWNDILVSDGFTTGNISDTRFEGKVRLGCFSGTIEASENTPVKCGIFRSFIRDCEIGDWVHLSDVRVLAGYVIENNIAIMNAGSITVWGESAFGNGTGLEVLNEGGGRELPIFDRLSSQIAWLTVLYRHDKEFTERILDLIGRYCNSKKSDRGLIQSGARILNTQTIRNVVIGNYTRIDGASLLEEGTIRSCTEAPVYIGTGVIARKFIVLSGSVVDTGAILDRCFVGQGVRIGKQFSAENSVFFANSEAFHGEACSLFAGPYSVTHHKSTLLIACMTSFFNAGSGTNQSNHMYKLGPVHQGIMERGCKTGSFSYLLLPVHIGAYSVVMGKHYSNFDTSDLPFSYISEEKGRSELTPAMNLITVGTRRDADKWPSRDRRKDPEKNDLIHFSLFNPFIADKIINGISILNELAEKAGPSQDFVSRKGIVIRRLLLKTTRKYYELALKIYTGQELVKRMRHLNENSTITDLNESMKSAAGFGTGKWTDLCGMLAPVSRIEELAVSVKTGITGSVDELIGFLKSIYSGYDDYSWEWSADLIKHQYGFRPENLPADSVIQIISEWKTNAIKLNSMVLEDARKEFDSSKKIGYGAGGGRDTADLDFQAIRGSFEDNRFVTGLQNEIKEIEAEAERLTGLLLKICKS